MSTNGLAAQALGAKNLQAGARVDATAAAGVAGRGAIVRLRYPLIELALRIVGGDGEVGAGAAFFFEICWLSVPAALAKSWCCWASCSAYVRAPVILLTSATC